MKPLRLTIARLMGIIFLMGFSFAALRNADRAWASASFSLAIVSVSVALAGALSRKGGARAPWSGFAFAGGASLLIRVLTAETVGSQNGPPRPILFIFQEHINPQASGGLALIAYTQTCNSLEAILLGLVGAVAGLLVSDWRHGR
jgi:glycerol uptake facilitator-like aquaporin